MALYDKRYPVYLKTMGFISAVIRDPNISDQTLMKFLRDVKDKEFLFGPDIHELLDMIYKKGLGLAACNASLKSQQDTEERKKLVEGQMTIIQWFTE